MPTTQSDAAIPSDDDRTLTDEITGTRARALHLPRPRRLPSQGRALSPSSERVTRPFEVPPELLVLAGAAPSPYGEAGDQSCQTTRILVEAAALRDTDEYPTIDLTEHDVELLAE